MASLKFIYIFAGEEELNQTYVSQYENMQITAILQPCPGDKFPDAHTETGQSFSQFMFQF